MIELWLSARCIWLYVIIMSHARFRVNLKYPICLFIEQLYGVFLVGIKFENWHVFKNYKHMADKNLVQDVINKGNMLILMNLYQKSWLVFFFVFFWKQSYFITRISRIIEKNLLCKSCYPMFALYEFKLFNYLTVLYRLMIPSITFLLK